MKRVYAHNLLLQFEKKRLVVKFKGLTVLCAVFDVAHL